MGIEGLRASKDLDSTSSAVGRQQKVLDLWNAGRPECCARKRRWREGYDWLCEALGGGEGRAIESDGAAGVGFGQQ